MYGLALVAIWSISTKRKMLARLTMASATPARLTGLRSSMRNLCRASCWGGGMGSVSMWCSGDHAFDCGFALGLCGGGLVKRFDSIQSVLVLIMMQRHFPVPPGPVHGIHIRIEKYLVEVPHHDRQRRQHRFIKMNS